jgi:hypothetical protein
MTDEKTTSELQQENSITVDELRSIPRFANFSDDELREVAESIKEFAILLNTIPSAEQIKN